MKKIFILPLFLAAIQVGYCKANSYTNTAVYIVNKPIADTLAIYTGKYQRTIHNDLFYIEFTLIDRELIGTTLWDGNKLALKHLSGDNFIVSGLAWAVKFMRDKDNKITQVLIRGTDYWVKVKN